MAVGFTRYEERTFTIRVKASAFDYVWSEEAIEGAKDSLDRAFRRFERAVGEITFLEIDTIDIVNVDHGPSTTI